MKETKSTQGSPIINTSTGYKTIKCQASVFHKNDEIGLKKYLSTIKEIELIHFIPLSTKDKTMKIFQTSKYPAIIVLVFIFSHEAILIFAKGEQTHIGYWLLTIAFSVIGFFATLIIDSVMIWKEHHN